MNRPCSSLGVLLGSLALSLVLVGSANSQTASHLRDASPCITCPLANERFGCVFDQDYTYRDTLEEIDQEELYTDQQYTDTDEPATAAADDYSDYEYNGEYGYYGYHYDEDGNYYGNDQYADESGSDDLESAPKSPAASVTPIPQPFYDYDDYDMDVYNSVEADAVAADAEVQAEAVEDESASEYDPYWYETYAPPADPVEAEQETSVEADLDVASAPAEEELYDLGTEYDPAYDDAMSDTQETVEAPAVTAPAVTAPAVADTQEPSVPQSGSNAYHAECFEGYGIYEFYDDSDYRCDLPDEYLNEQYEYFYGSQPESTADAGDPCEQAELDQAASTEAEVVTEAKVASEAEVVTEAEVAGDADIVDAESVGAVAAPVGTGIVVPGSAHVYILSWQFLANAAERQAAADVAAKASEDAVPTEPADSLEVAAPTFQLDLIGGTADLLEQSSRVLAMAAEAVRGWRAAAGVSVGSIPGEAERR